MIAELSKSFPFVWGLSLLGGACSALILYLFNESSFPSSPSSPRTLSSVFDIIDRYFCTMLSAENVRTANKQCVSIPKKEELPYNGTKGMSSLQCCCFWPFSSQFSWGSTGEPPAHNTLTWAPDPSFLHRSPAFMGRTRVAHASHHGNMEVQAVAWEAGGGFYAPEGEQGLQPMCLRKGAGCPAPSSSGGSQHRNSSWDFPFQRKKSQVLRDAGTASARQQLRSGIAFLDFCACNCLTALSRVPWPGFSFAFMQLHPLSNSGLSFQVKLCFIVRVLGWRSTHRGKMELLSQGDTAAHCLLLLNTGVQPSRINLQDHKLCTLQLGV